MTETQEPEAEDDVTAAIRMAKDYVRKLWRAENIANLGLEEVVHDGGDRWRITLGFTRPWDGSRLERLGGSMFASSSPATRTYKVVHVDLHNKEVTAVANRDINSSLSTSFSSTPTWSCCWSPEA